MGIPFLFALVFAMAYPPIESEPPYHQPSMASASIVFALGIFSWCFVLWSIIRWLRAGIEGGSRWAAVSFVPLAAYALGLYVAYIAIRHR